MKLLLAVPWLRNSSQILAGVKPPVLRVFVEHSFFTKKGLPVMGRMPCRDAPLGYVNPELNPRSRVKIVWEWYIACKHNVAKGSELYYPLHQKGYLILGCYCVYNITFEREWGCPNLYTKKGLPILGCLPCRAELLGWFISRVGSPKWEVYKLRNVLLFNVLLLGETELPSVSWREQVYQCRASAFWGYNP